MIQNHCMMLCIKDYLQRMQFKINNMQPPNVNGGGLNSKDIKMHVSGLLGFVTVRDNVCCCLLCCRRLRDKHNIINLNHG